MRKTLWVCVCFVLLTAVLVACGEKSQEEVVQELDKKLQEMDTYKANATMTLVTGEEPRTYDVEIWHMQNEKNKYYKVNLQNENEKQNQMIIRNDDGVFVLTPALNKSFRFQSDWPNNNSQVYLYESLISDILMDADRTFAAHEGNYVFETKTNYQNKHLNHQEIVIDAKTLHPHTVKIYDSDFQLLVTVDFTSFDEDVTFDVNDFDKDKNMAGAEAEMAATTPEEKEEEMTSSHSFEVVYPSFEPQGTSLEDTQEETTEDGKKVVLSFTGDKPFTIIQQTERAEEVATSVPMGVGEPVDLGFTIGILTEDSLTWHDQGIEFFLASSELTKEEMTAIARSMNHSTATVK